jgi:hypothetical protein
MQRYELTEFIRNARAVSSDPQLEHQMLNSLLAHVHGASDKFLDAYYHSDNFVHNPAVLGLREPAQRTHDVDHGHQTEDKPRNLIEQGVLRKPRRLADLIVLGEPVYPRNARSLGVD